MSWRIGCWYWRRDGGVALFDGISLNMPVFHHPDLSSKYVKDGLLAHEWNGKVSCSRHIRPYCRPYDVISDDSDNCI